MPKRGNEKLRALENLGGAQKTQRKDEVENGTGTRADSRRSGGYTVAYLREKNDLMQKWKMEDMQLQKQRLKVESKKEEQSRNQHQDLMQVMLQQTKLQQKHKQNTALKKLLRLGDYKCSNYSTVQKKCKRNSVFFVFCSREISP